LNPHLENLGPNRSGIHEKPIGQGFGTGGNPFPQNFIQNRMIEPLIDPFLEPGKFPEIHHEPHLIQFFRSEEQANDIVMPVGFPALVILR
jgi:hypothetical protein